MIRNVIIEEVLISNYLYTCRFDNGQTTIEIPKGRFALNKLPRPKRGDILPLVQKDGKNSIFINGKELKSTQDI